MREHLPALIVVVPLMAGLFIQAVGWLNKKLCYPLTVAALTASAGIAVALLGVVVAGETSVDYRLGGWPPPWGIYYRIDALSAMVIVLIFGVATVNLLGNRPIIEAEIQDQVGSYCALYVLFVTGLSGIVATGDAFNLYVLLEISSLTGYALIGYGDGRAPLAGLHYLFMGTIGASLYLLGVGYLYLMTGTLNMADLAAILPGRADSPVITLAFALCLSGLLVKMALFPLHGWLPNAYTHAPSATAGLVAPLTTKVMIYVMIRISLSVFTPEYVFGHIRMAETVVWMAVAAIFSGSFLALSQTRLKRMLTYIIVAEVGYMVGGFWLGNRSGMTGAMLHIVNDAVMTLCLFMFAGALIHRVCDDEFSAFKGVFKTMPFSMAAFILAALSMIGVPPTCGFFSKWYLIMGGLSAGQYGFVTALIFSSLVNMILFFRIIEIGFFHTGGHSEGADHEGPDEIREAPVPMVISLLLVACCLVLLGVYTGDIVTRIIDPVLPAFMSAKGMV